MHPGGRFNHHPGTVQPLMLSVITVAIIAAIRPLVLSLVPAAIPAAIRPLMLSVIPAAVPAAIQPVMLSVIPAPILVNPLLVALLWRYRSDESSAHSLDGPPRRQPSCALLVLIAVAPLRQQRGRATTRG